MKQQHLIRFIFCGLLVLLGSCKPQQILQSGQSTKKVQKAKQHREEQPFCTGAENTQAYLSLLQNKKVGVVTNATGQVGNQHLVDFLLQKNIAITRIFAPEHGFRGTADAGEHLDDGTDSRTGLPIVSLYGSNKKPKPEQLEGLDILLFDIQDVGARFYTYISTLHYVMEACAEANLPLLVLDRPNPNGGTIDGPALDMAYTSFVGMHPIPVLHGLTIGEYALMINGEGWLKNGVQCPLSVIPCLGYKKSMHYHVPVRPSPNLPNDQAIKLYASLCFFEGTPISVGRGTDKQFQLYGAPPLPDSGFSFTPQPNEGAKEPLYKGQICYGENLSMLPFEPQLDLQWLLKTYQLWADKKTFFTSFFTKLAGSPLLQQQIESELDAKAIKQSWQADLKQFDQKRQAYLRYSLK
jgi:uncharacterized protein YbbC (DUF1343 family)